jgi:hypothetical protein
VKGHTLVSVGKAGVYLFFRYRIERQLHKKDAYAVVSDIDRGLKPNELPSLLPYLNRSDSRQNVLQPSGFFCYGDDNV